MLKGDGIRLAALVPIAGIKSFLNFENLLETEDRKRRVRRGVCFKMELVKPKLCLVKTRRYLLERKFELRIEDSQALVELRIYLVEDLSEKNLYTVLRDNFWTARIGELSIILQRTELCITALIKASNH